MPKRSRPTREQMLIPFPDPNADGDPDPPPEVEAKLPKARARRGRARIEYDEAEAALLCGLGSATGADARLRRQHLVTARAYAISLAVHGVVEGVGLTIRADGELCAQAETVERRAPSLAAVLAVILMGLGPRQRTLVCELLPRHFGPGVVGIAIPEEFDKLAKDVINRLKTPQPKRGSVKWAGQVQVGGSGPD